MIFLSFLAFAQSPQLNLKGKDSLQVKMSQLLVNVKIVGNIAYTTSEMHFTNKSNRQMEAELLFPLPEGVSVSRYAIDLNGKMRDAVPVDKNKGKQVFEAIEHRRVDPGLLERVEGNNFKTRIYPIMPNGERIVIIGYEQELSSFDKGNLAYQMVSKYAQKLDKFEVVVDVIGANSQPSLVNNAGQTSVLELNSTENWQKTFQTSIKKTNYQPSENILIKIPIQQEIPNVVMQNVGGEHYFYANTFIENKKILKVKPNSIGLIWDMSLSCKNRDLKKELNLLDEYFKNIRNTSVSLYLMSYNFDKKGTFNVSNGNWSDLKLALENAKYDGGTRFSQIKLQNHDEFFFFTDGLSSLSSNLLPKTTKPIYTISSSVASDFAFLNYNSMKTGGSFINLNEIKIELALDKILYQNLKFLGVKENFLVTEVYPSIGTAVSGSFSISGISLNPKNDLILLFGYDNYAIIEKKVNLNSETQLSTEVNIEKLWAQKKIADLDLQYKKNEDEIEMMGKKYGIITQNTSLIVLENIADYIQYDIVPPTELREEFDRILKQNRANVLAQQQSGWKNVDNYYNQLQDWWKADYKYKAPKREVVEEVRPRASRNVPTRNGFVVGTITDSNGNVISGVNISISGKRNSTNSDYDGTYSIEAIATDVLVFDFIGMQRARITVRKNKTINVRMRVSGQELQEVVVTGQGVRKQKRMTTSSSVTIRSNAIEAAPSGDSSMPESRPLASPVANVIEVERALSGKVAGVQISEEVVITNNVNIRGMASLKDKKTEEKSDNESDDIIEVQKPKVVKVTSWNPDRIYLKAMKSAPEDKKYEAYLQLRDAQETNPSFYFDVANFFYDNNDKPKALLVLSNIADLGLENHQLYKSLTYVLRQWQAYEDALFTANQVVKWRTQEPQAHRDLALALEDNKQYQAAFDELIKGLDVNYYGEMSGQYSGVEDIILMDLNRLKAEHTDLKTGKLDKKYLDKMPVAVRIIMNWNQMDVDIDMHVIEPNGEECYYGHKTTEIGARFSKDFTQGYGPEQYLLRNEVKGKFQIKTNFFGERTLTESGPTTVNIEIYTYKNGKTERTMQTVQLSSVKQNQNLAEIVL
jgi:hypothetical protein